MAVTVDIDLQGIKDKLSRENLIRSRRTTANQMMADMNKFVPAKEYILRNTVTIGVDGGTVVYNAPYASAQFYNQHFNYTTPGTGPRWDKKAKGMFMFSWVKAFLGGLNL